MIDRAPDNPSTYLTLAEIYTGHAWIDAATTHYEKALALAPNNLDYIAAFGDFYLRHGNREKALETWNTMVTGDKANAMNFQHLAQLLKTKNFKKEAIAAIRTAVALMPEEYRHSEKLAEYLMENEEYDKALAAYNTAIALAPNPFFVDKLNDKVIELYRRQGTLTQQAKTLETELENPARSETERSTQQLLLTKMYLKMGNISYALEVLLKAKQQKPRDVHIHRWLAELYYRQGRWDAAHSIYKHLITIDSANAREYYTKIAKSHLNILDFDAATDTAKQIIAQNPRAPDGHQLLAHIAVHSENYAAAIDSLKNAMRLQPEDIKIRTELAKVYRLAGKPQHAVAQYWQCWHLSDTVTDKLALIKPLSEIYNTLGKPDALKTELKKLAKSNTAQVAATLALAELQRTQDDLQGARFLLAKALNKQRNNPALLYHFVNINLALNDMQTALTYQQQLVKVQPTADNQQQLGEILFDLGREQEAIQVWTQLLHAKNQPLTAEVKLAARLLRNGLQAQAAIVLERTAEKITSTDAHLPRYQLGALLVAIDEPERAIPHFHSILNMAEQTDTLTEKTTDPSTIHINSIHRNHFTISYETISDIQSKPAQWNPKH